MGVRAPLLLICTFIFTCFACFFKSFQDCSRRHFDLLTLPAGGRNGIIAMSHALPALACADCARVGLDPSSAV